MREDGVQFANRSFPFGLKKFVNRKATLFQSFFFVLVPAKMWLKAIPCSLPAPDHVKYSMEGGTRGEGGRHLENIFLKKKNRKGGRRPPRAKIVQEIYHLARTQVEVLAT